MPARRALCLVCASLALCQAFADVIITQGVNFSVDVHPGDGRVAMDLNGMIWVLPARGGEARILTDSLEPARQPRWSPDGSKILYQASAPDGAGLRLLDVETATVQRIGDGSHFDLHASWHPGGERIVFSSDRRGSGFDIWETDLPTGLSWRISEHPGDEIEPAWSRNGRHLAYIRKLGEQYSLVLRRHGEPEEVLLVSNSPMSSPSWRPDGTLLTILVHDPQAPAIDMVILSDPPLVRRLAVGEDFMASPVSWRDRQRFVYTADGLIKTRGFDELRSRALPFRATIADPEPRPTTVIAKRELVVEDPPSGRLVIRGARLFDGIWDRYRTGMDVLIENGRIAALESRRSWEDATLLDLGDVTVLPGFIDVWSAMPGEAMAVAGPRMLAYGVTTVVTDEPVPDGMAWAGDETPGPRVLRATDIAAIPADGAGQAYFFAIVPAGSAGSQETLAAMRRWRELGVPIVAESWKTGVGIGADLLVGALPVVSISGQDKVLAARGDPLTLISGLADAGTPGISSLLESRQARQFDHHGAPGRRYSSLPPFLTSQASIVLGSKPNGLPPGLALHAELRALAAAGLGGSDLFKATGSDAAMLLGLENQIGRITPGALADLVLVSGDPLGKPADALSIVAVVRNGRFFSLIGLIEKATANVE